MLRKHIVKWQIVVAGFGMALIIALLGTAALTVATTIVPDVGGSYVEAIVGRPSVINPILSQGNQANEDISSLVFSGLMRVNSSGQLEPDLAQSWAIQDDGKTYVFTLKPDLKWQDGQPVVADDIVYTIKAIQDPDYKGSSDYADLWRGTVVEKVNDSTVRFRLKDVYSPFLEYTTQGILPAHKLGAVSAAALPQNAFNAQPIGTGPFKVVKATQTEVVLEASETYYGRKPYVNQIRFKFYDTYDRAIEALRQEQVQGLGGIPASSVASLRQNQRVTLNYFSESSLLTILLFNLDDPLFSNVIVRQAVAYGIDSDRLIDTVLGGQGKRAYGPIVPQSWAYKPDTRHYDYNPTEARALLEKDGWVDGDGDGIREKQGQKLRFVLLTNDSSQRIMTAQEISRELEAIGFDVEVQATSWSGVLSDFLVPHKFQAVLAEQLSPNADPDSYQFWHSSQIKQGLNVSGWANRQADDLLEKGRRMTSTEDRIKVYGEFQTIFANDLPGVPLYYPVYAFALNNQIKGTQFSLMVSPSDRFHSLLEWYVKTKRVLGSVEVPKSSDNNR